MEIIVGETAGFCFGVANAVNKSKDLLKNNNDICCLGELVHNKDVINELEQNGLKFIDNIKDAKKSVIIRAHGEPKSTYEIARELKLNIIDLTCPKVINIHKIVQEYSSNGYYIFLIGQKTHPEIVGTISYCGKNSNIIEKEEDVNNAIIEFRKTNIKKILIISQTTFSLEKFEIISNLINKSVGNNYTVEIKNTICNATKLRQDETKKIAQIVDAIIIIGGKNSSNTGKLYSIASKYCENSILIQNEKELNVENIKNFSKIGIMAGASTPKKSIDSVVEMLKLI